MEPEFKNKHSAFWGIMVIAGTVIGGGMFALPVDLAGSWFFWGAFILIITWFSMLHSGLLLLEANLNYPIGSSFNTITKDLLGNTWNIINGITVAFVLYILTYAYISANGAILSETIAMQLGHQVNPRLVGIATALFVGAVLWFSSLAASRITSLFLGIKILAFVIVFGSFFFRVDYATLTDATAGMDQRNHYFPYIFMALPVCLASFGFHGNIPSLIICYGKRKDKLIKSLVFGSLLALVIYLFWLYCTMGNIPREAFKDIIAAGGNVDSLVKSFIGTTPGRVIEFFLLVFSNLAVASSFFGVTLGLFDYLADLFNIDNSSVGRLKTVLLTFIPPALLYLLFPNGFLYGIGGAGLCATIWAVIVPAILGLKSRQKFPQQLFTVWGGKVIPVLVILFGLLVIACWFGKALNLLPVFS
ncbi:MULTISPECIES: low affinity tryptophan permease TnaB [Edwardsiella]|uniref:Aromatic amino acid permease n=2 Tax=Edwardsiella anguillarum TaxID=1821960 RepID=A0A076LMP3_9GAMM|nr:MULTISPECIES: low affinity tryptophan permease TnaB [Edwardsiella]AIJ09151.1 Tryptophan-specific transport protein [Edwardsiella anguillarum ET080813]AKR77083.1 low affinity tryptophan permease TnaB [Edwardsiella sp. LADL05-105]KAB0589998.1 low affinity tryptophan permease TnaB [Edwardsiella anguillarum]UOU80247.1 low affinity tryptophan permease TnaB [Edwardsiella anguillarum]WHP84731.1 low affinity tryptophan permease TnaB [Edwardsiella anguillarum]